MIAKLLAGHAWAFGGATCLGWGGPLMLQESPAGCSGRCCCSAIWPGPLRSRVTPAWHDREAGWDVAGSNLDGLLPRILLPTLKACLPVHPLCGSGLDRHHNRLQTVASGTQESSGYCFGPDDSRSRPTLSTGLVICTAGSLCPAEGLSPAGIMVFLGSHNLQCLGWMRA